MKTREALDNISKRKTNHGYEVSSLEDSRELISALKYVYEGNADVHIGKIYFNGPAPGNTGYK